MASRRTIGLVLSIVGLTGILAAAVLIPYVTLRDASGTFQRALKAGGYPTAEITKTRVASPGGKSSKAYDARIRVGEGCLLHLQMRQPGLLFGHGYSLVEVNGELLRLDGSPTYDQARAYAGDHGYGKCKT